MAVVRCIRSGASRCLQVERTDPATTAGGRHYAALCAGAISPKPLETGCARSSIGMRRRDENDARGTPLLLAWTAREDEDRIVFKLPKVCASSTLVDCPPRR